MLAKDRTLPTLTKWGFLIRMRQINGIFSDTNTCTENNVRADLFEKVFENTTDSM